MNRNHDQDAEHLTETEVVDIKKFFSASLMPRTRFNKNWIYNEDQDTEDLFARKKENARKMREKIIQDLGLPTEVIRDIMNGDAMHG